ncbi:MAG: hypothetical protein FGM24_05225 [Candidatus Kapabacteria bacterium]|nr:hypothetical protein [Candidatus Kapabacteria bacterium]
MLRIYGRAPTSVTSRMLLLFDIDQTLVTVRDGIGRHVVGNSFAQTFGIDVTDFLLTFSFAGQTDRAIMARLADHAGIDATKADAGWEKYRALVEQDMLDGVHSENVDVLPGVRDLVEMLRHDPRYSLGLVTGNIRRIAFHKLGVAGLDHAFEHGAYGCEHANRSQLPPLALHRVNVACNTSFTPADCVVVGDAPNDVQCARDNGMACLAVATGGIDAEQLRQAGAHVVVESFADVDGVLQIFESMRG